MVPSTTSLRTEEKVSTSITKIAAALDKIEKDEKTVYIKHIGIETNEREDPIRTRRLIEKLLPGTTECEILQSGTIKIQSKNNETAI
jgi:hypothetical protein